MDARIAIVGIGCRLPGASSPDAYWRNLVDGVESVREFCDAELEESGVPQALLASPGYVKRAPVLDDVAAFDAKFFGFSATDAALTDPQQRVFLEVCRDALDDSGLTLTARTVRTGVFATSGGIVSTYLLAAVETLAKTRSLATGGPIHLGNDKDFVATRASFKLDLRGPSINVQTACSSSIVALHLACQSLLMDECELALAGASCVRVPQYVGYDATLDPILAKDGRCRPFDAAASGTLFGSGAGAVVLRRYADAVRDGDQIYAVIRGTGINNDGGQKVSYTAASVPGQRACIEATLARAEVSADDLGYVECHGTATKIGDPLEIKSLVQAFRKTSERAGFCGIGSVKSNIGHLEQAAGMASLIKTVLMLKHATYVPSLHCDVVNPKVALAGSPFYVVRETAPWSTSSPERLRTAGVSCLGMGGTNAFVVLQEHRVTEQPGAADLRRDAGPCLFCLSARTPEALSAYAARYAHHLASHRDHLRLEDVAYTTNLSRAEFGCRVAWIVDDSDGLIAELERCATNQEAHAPVKRLPLTYACGVDHWFDAADLTHALVTRAPMAVRALAEESARTVAASTVRWAEAFGPMAMGLLRDVASVFVCEIVAHATLCALGAVFDKREGDGLGGQIVPCLDDPSRLSSALEEVSRAVVAWLPSATDVDHAAAAARATHRDVHLPSWSRVPESASERASTYEAFVRFVRERSAQTKAEPTSAPQAADRRYFQAHDDGHGAPQRIAVATQLGASGDLAGLARALYLSGVNIAWDRYYTQQTPRKVSLPTYPYQRESYWFTDLTTGER